MTLLRSPLLDAAGFRHAFAERGAGPDTVERALGVSRVIQVKQVHGNRTVEARDVGPLTEADAIVSRASRTPFAAGIRVADCVSVLVADPTAGDVVAIHCGWRGVVQHVVREAVSRLAGNELLAAVGPCIGPCCFEVDRSVAEAIASASGGEVVSRQKGDKAWVDLRAAVRAQLLKAPGKQVRVDEITGCTKHEPGRFHSFRRDGANSGRMLSAIRAKVAT